LLDRTNTHRGHAEESLDTEAAALVLYRNESWRWSRSPNALEEFARQMILPRTPRADVEKLASPRRLGSASPATGKARKLTNVQQVGPETAHDERPHRGT
jgi:hypothetical protein